MSYLIDIHKRILKDMIESEVDFIVAGGYAVIYHGYVRTTGDMDIWLKPDNGNKEKLIKVLVKNNIHNDSIDLVSHFDFTSSIAFHFGSAPEKMDFFTTITGLDFDAAMKNVVFLKIENLKIPFLSLSDLVTNKMMTTRNKDAVDVEELQKIRMLRRKKK
jgi:hypothetical protein